MKQPFLLSEDVTCAPHVKHACVSGPWAVAVRQVPRGRGPAGRAAGMCLNPSSAIYSDPEQVRESL